VPLSAGFTDEDVIVSDPPVPDGEVVLWGLGGGAGSMRATYTDPLGTVWDLSDTSDSRGYFTTQQVGGWGAPVFEIVTDAKPRGGETIRFIRPEPARITWPLHIWGDTHIQFVQRYRDIRRAFLLTAHMNQPGLLRVARPDGSAREAEVWYEEGFKGESGENWVSANPVLTLFVPDGAWRDVNPVVITRNQGSPSDFFSNFPAVSSSQVLGDTTIFNPGDMAAWPVWTITGPCTTLTATNATTGQTFTLTATLTSGQTATITTDRPTVRGPAGENLVGQLNWPTAYLWGLAPRDNAITFVVSGGGPASQIQLAFTPRYEGA
jgi:hypothetical protein